MIINTYHCSRLDDHGLWLKSLLLDVLPPSMCCIFRSGPSGSQMDNHWSGLVPLKRSVFHRALEGEGWTPTSPWSPSSSSSPLTYWFCCYRCCWSTLHQSIWLPEGPLMKTPHTDGGETSSRRDFAAIKLGQYNSTQRRLWKPKSTFHRSKLP